MAFTGWSLAVSGNWLAHEAASALPGVSWIIHIDEVLIGLFVGTLHFAMAKHAIYRNAVRAAYLNHSRARHSMNLLTHDVSVAEIMERSLAICARHGIGCEFS